MTYKKRQTFAQFVYGMTMTQLRREVFRLNNCIIGTARHPRVKQLSLCLDPECDGTCGVEKADHPYVPYFNTETGKVNRAHALRDEVLDDEE
jgi:hypothetical protein